ncbi:MAG: ECF transporter S component [Lactobacillaceae bacterium]|jgi:energy-coupling factor transport system substrate-specific component|nr:ECF transporter S component [Lactobacillaceae bacterium]
MKTVKWTIKDVILTALIGIIFGALYLGFGFLWETFIKIIGPLAGFIANKNLSGALTGAAIAGKVTTAATTGLWMMAGPLAALVIKKPGAALFGELLASFVEMTLGSHWGVDNVIWGVVQGVASELGFALTGYRNYKIGLMLSIVTGSIISFGFNYLKYSYDTLNTVFVTTLFAIFFLSVLFFSGILVWLINKLLISSKILRK